MIQQVYHRLGSVYSVCFSYAPADFTQLGLRGPLGFLWLTVCLHVSPIYCAQNLGSFACWSKVEIVLHGPMIGAGWTGDNPFRIEVNGRFQRPDGSLITVPGFYDGDGEGGQYGDVWKIRLAPDVLGSWRLTTISAETRLNNQTFTFSVIASDRPGILSLQGNYYLKFANGSYWFKSGADDPEQILGEGVFGDWNAKRAAIDYLAGKKINSMFVTLLDYPGDSGLVYPWLTTSDQETYDLAKMARWTAFLEYIAAKNIVLHITLEDDGAVFPVDRTFYYRQIVARFAHLAAVEWNIREEALEQYSTSQIQSYAALFSSINPYKQPLTVHSINNPESWFINNALFTLTSIQWPKPSAEYPPSYYFSAVARWRDATASRPMCISIDETGRTTTSSEDRALARKMEWAIAFGGGVFELHTLPSATFPEYDSHWNDMMYLRHFMEALPFWQMTPDSQIVSDNALALIQTGERYAVYAPEGGTVVLNLSGTSGTFSYCWYDPLTGTYSDRATVMGGSSRSFTAPFQKDAALLVQKMAAPIADLRAMVVSDAILLDWSALAGVTHYHVYRGTSYNFVPSASNRIASSISDQDASRAGVQFTDDNINHANVVGDTLNNYFYKVTGLYPAEGLESNVAGEFDYPLKTTFATDINALVILFNTQNTDAPITNAEQLANAVPYCTNVYYWSASGQGSIGHPKGTPINNFSIKLGTPYFVNVTADSVWTVAGAYDSFQFNLITTTGTDINAVSVPLARSYLTSAEALSQDLFACTNVYLWVTSGQGFVGHPLGTPINNFPVRPGYPYMVNVSYPSVWPAALSKRDMRTFPSVAAVEFRGGGIPHTAFGRIDFSDQRPAALSIQMRAWICGREHEVLTEASTGSYGDGEFWALSVGNFPTPWQKNEILHVELLDTANRLQGAEEITLTTSGSEECAITLYPVNDAFSLPALSPGTAILSANYPNPFNERTEICYELPMTTLTTLAVYDVSGRRVKTLQNAEQQAGSYHVFWDGTDEGGIPAGSGIYFCHLVTPMAKKFSKLMLIR